VTAATIAEQVRAARVAAGLTQVQLADLAHLRQATIAEVESGWVCGGATLRALAVALDAPLVVHPHAEAPRVRRPRRG
jgi:predicted transcriptional regulator